MHERLIRTMNSPAGRIGRIVLGLAMVGAGIAWGGLVGLGIGLAGLVPMVPAFLGRCV